MSDYSSRSSSAASFQSAHDGPLSRHSQHPSLNSAPHASGAGLSSTPQRGRSGASYVPPAADDDLDDWGSFELSDDDGAPAPFGPGRLSPSEANAAGDSLRLHRYAEAGAQHLEPGSLPHVLTGIYADPAAKKDDWADDFDFELEAPGEPDGGGLGVPSPYLESLHETRGSSGRLPPPESPVINRKLFSRLNIPHLDIGGGRPPSAPSQASAHADDTGEDIPADSAAHPAAALLPVLGYDAEEVHQSCAHLKELFGRHSAAIQTHVDDVFSELGNLSALDQRAAAMYLFSSDADVSLLAEAHRDAAADVLEWKLELARLTGDDLRAAKAMMGLAQCASRAGDVEVSQTWLDKVAALAASFPPSTASVALGIEADYEGALNKRRLGQLDAANSILAGIVDRAGSLSGQTADACEEIPPEQRSIWWTLRAKVLLAEVCREQGQGPRAIQLFAEYSLECIARMIGLIGGPTPGQGLLWYSLFSPNSLVHAIWSCTRSLFEMRAFFPAQELAAVVMHSATLFGNKSVNDSAAELRTQARAVLREHKRQLAALRASADRVVPPPSAVPSFGGFDAPKQWEEATAQSSAPVEDDWEGSVDDEEDWDKMLEEEWNIKIDTGSNGVGLDNGTPVEQGAVMAQAAYVDDTSFISGTPNAFHGGQPPPNRQLSAYQRTGSADLMEGELRLYLNRIHGSAASLSVHQMYPKPTVPFEGPILGVREHETFLRNFVRGKDPRFRRAQAAGMVDAVWNSNDVVEKQRRNPMKQFRSKSLFVDRLSSRWTTLVLGTVWNILRGEGAIEEKRGNVRTLLQATIREATELTGRVPIIDETERMERLDMLSGLLEAMRLSREILTTDGQESIWFSKSCSMLGQMASTVKPAAKAAVELFQAESRAHYGVVAVTPPSYIIQCSAGESACDNEALPSSSRLRVSDIGASLRHSVVDILHALFWRTKSGFDENSSSTSFERLVHADVASTLFLTGSGVSSIDGSRINVAKDEAILNLRSRAVGAQGAAGHVVDETRRVSGPELVQELNTMWASLPSSAAAVRAKVSFALAHHSGAEPHEYGRTEQILFDGLQSLHSVTVSSGNPVSFFSMLTRVSPIAVVSSPLSEAMLQAYGRLTLQHSKYRYGIAALEAATDSRRIHDLKKQSSLATAMQVVTAARSQGDWRRALVLLHDLRTVIHPKDGMRNDFMHLCLLVHQICLDVGCFSASVVPLRAFSALIYEERLRVLLRRYRRRLARKSKNRQNRQRMHFSSSPLPTVMTKTPSLKMPGASLAALLESPRRLTGAEVDDASMRTPVAADSRDRPETTPLAHPPKNARMSRTPSWRLRRTPSKNMARSASSNAAGAEEESEEDSRRRIRFSRTLSRKKSKLGSAVKKRPRSKAHMFEEEQKELLRIEAEQELVADVERFQVEFQLIKTAFAAGNYSDADSRCRSLLEMTAPHNLRYKACEVRANIALKRREIIRCLELIDAMEKEYQKGFLDGSNAVMPETGPGVTKGSSPFFQNEDSLRSIGNAESAKSFIPAVTFMKLSALLHGRRLAEGLSTADEALKACPETQLWNRARLHYLRGKILFEISSISTAPFEHAEGPSGLRSDLSPLDVQNINFTLSAFETASRYYDAAGDEVGTLKSDLLWARTCIDTLFRRVVLPREAGGGVPLDSACRLGGRTISPHEVEEAVHTVLYTASAANLPIMLIDALAALAEIKMIRGETANAVNVWVAHSWRLFSRLLTDSEDFTLILTSVAPVSTLMRLRKMCGRLVRLVLCGQRAADVAAINRHLHMFEAYVTLQIDIDRRMSLATGSPRKATAENEQKGAGNEQKATGSEQKSAGNEDISSAATKSSGEERKRPPGKPESQSEAALGHHTSIHDRLASVKKHYGRERVPESAETKSRNSSDSRGGEWSNHPSGTLMHILGSEGAALGRLISRPRKHVISAVRDTGAVLIPSNFFTNSRTQEKYTSHVLGKDAELIFPFEENLGVGAMQILDGPARKQAAASEDFPLPNSAVHDRAISSESTDMNGSVNDAPPSAAESPTVKRTLSFLNPDGSRWVAAVEREEEQSEAGDNITPQVAHSPSQGSQTQETPISSRIHSLGGPELVIEEATNESRIRFERSSMPSELVDLVEIIRAADSAGGRPLPPTVFGETIAERVWAHLHRIKEETRRYVHGGLTMQQLGDRNREAVRSWLLCLPRSNKEWTVPESIAKRLVYVLFAHGVLGYYVVDRGGCIGGVALGGKQVQEAAGSPVTSSAGTGSNWVGPRPITDSERTYLSNLVRHWKRGEVWYKDRDSEIINGISGGVVRAPRTLLTPHHHSHKTKGRPIVLIADATVQVLPWELFFDHVVIRSLSLLGIIRGVQEDPPAPVQSAIAYNALVSPNTLSNRSITRIVCFTTSRRESGDLLKTEEARRQDLAFKSLLRLNHLNAPALISKLKLGDFSDPTAVNAVAMPTGPLSTPLTQSRKPTKLFGLRLEAIIGQPNFPHVDFLRVPGLGSATADDLREATMALLARVNEKDGEMRDVSEYITVFLFTYADLIGGSQSVFGLTSAVPRGILMFAPATHMKVLARHLEDDELTRGLDRVAGGAYRKRANVCACARILVEYVSRFAREKRIPIVIFLGEGLVDVFPRKRGAQRGAKPAAESLFQRPPPNSPFR